MTQLELSERASELAGTTDSPKLGRKRDLTRDPAILEAAIDVLAEAGYEGMTIDMVAARAKAGKATLYRRWSSKAELVIDAVGCMKKAYYDEAGIPDTGTVRGDLIALVRPQAFSDGEKDLQVLVGVVSMFAREPQLVEAVRGTFIEPRVRAYRQLLQRAIERGEIRSDVDVEMLATIGPAMAIFRLLILRKPVDREFLISLIDDIVIPACAATLS
jgi:AcrR family transcriptional regulator